MANCSKCGKHAGSTHRGGGDISCYECKANEKEGAVRKILTKVWNPIGFDVPEDEYDEYLPDVLIFFKERNYREMKDYLRLMEVWSFGCSGNIDQAIEEMKKL